MWCGSSVVAACYLSHPKKFWIVWLIDTLPSVPLVFRLMLASLWINSLTSLVTSCFDCQLAYKESTGAIGQLMSSEPVNSEHLQSSLVPCFPLHALLVAMNRTTVDYFSLDVEGYELDVSISRLNFKKTESVSVWLITWFNTRARVIWQKATSPALVDIFCHVKSP